MATLPRLPQIAPKGALPCETFRCSACCHGTEMLLTEGDVTRIALEHPDLDFVFSTDDGFLQLRTRPDPPLPGFTGAPCLFLDGVGRCSIHAIRPEGCRLYPAVWDADHDQVLLDGDYCPHPDDFALTPQTRDAVRRLAHRLVQERDHRVAGADPTFGKP